MGNIKHNTDKAQWLPKTAEIEQQIKKKNYNTQGHQPKDVKPFRLEGKKLREKLLHCRM